MYRSSPLRSALNMCASAKECHHPHPTPPHPTPPYPMWCVLLLWVEKMMQNCACVYLWLQSVCAGDSGKWLCAHVTPVCVCGWMWVEKMMQNCACVYLWLQSVCAGNPLTIPQPDLLGTQSEQFFHSGEDSEMVGRCWKMFLRPFEKLQSCQVFFFGCLFRLGSPLIFLFTGHHSPRITPLPRYESPLTIEAVASVLYYFTLLKPIINPSLPLLPTRCNFQFCEALLATVAHERFRFRLESPSAHIMSSWWSLAGKRPHPRCIYPSNPRWMSKRMFILRA